MNSDKSKCSRKLFTPILGQINHITFMAFCGFRKNRGYKRYRKAIARLLKNKRFHLVCVMIFCGVLWEKVMIYNRI